MQILRWNELHNAPPPGTELPSWLGLEDGVPAMVELGICTEPDGPFRLLLLRSGSSVHAFVNRCAHFGVPLAAKQNQLIYQPHTSITCNVHYARYRWSDGVCESGECAGERLLPVPLCAEEDGRLRIGA